MTKSNLIEHLTVISVELQHTIQLYKESHDSQTNDTTSPTPVTPNNVDPRNPMATPTSLEILLAHPQFKEIMSTLIIEEFIKIFKNTHILHTPQDTILNIIEKTIKKTCQKQINEMILNLRIIAK